MKIETVQDLANACIASNIFTTNPTVYGVLVLIRGGLTTPKHEVLALRAMLNLAESHHCTNWNSVAQKTIHAALIAKTDTESHFLLVEAADLLRSTMKFWFYGIALDPDSGDRVLSYEPGEYANEQAAKVSLAKKASFEGCHDVRIRGPFDSRESAFAARSAEVNELTSALDHLSSDRAK